MSTIIVSAFRWVPPFAKGLVRDLRVRWALEEAGLRYETRLLDQGEQNSSAYRTLQPFGQVPIYEEDGLVLFESGAIVHHIGQRCEALLPADPATRARAVTWMFAALNSVEPHLQHLALIDLFYAAEDWAKLRRPGAVDMVTNRLAALASVLEGREFLEGHFTAGDLLMTTVLRLVRHTELVAQFPVVEAYQRRCEARPAFRKALAAQMADFVELPAA